MLDYRVYFLRNGHIERVEIIMANNDDEAVELATRIADGSDIEVWCRGRMVAKRDAT